jgi:hypothetical protein
VEEQKGAIDIVELVNIKNIKHLYLHIILALYINNEKSNKKKKTI